MAIDIGAGRAYRGERLYNVALERDQEQRRRLAEETALGRIASPDDVALAVAFYAADDSEFITGSTAPVNGGLAMNGRIPETGQESSPCTSPT